MLRRENEEAVPFQATAVPLRIQDVRLVIPLWDHVTGEVKDTVVEEVRGGTPIVEPEYGSNRPTHTRYIAGPENIEIPWPEAEMTEHKAEAADTLRVHVDEMSYFLSLTHLPMPESVIDELRNKYSRSRNNHEQVYVQKKMREDAKEQWKNRRRMVLPQQEYWEHKAKQKDTQAQPEVTQETLELIREMQAASLGTSRQRETGVSS